MRGQSVSRSLSHPIGIECLGHMYIHAVTRGRWVHRCCNYARSSNAGEAKREMLYNGAVMSAVGKLTVCSVGGSTLSASARRDNDVEQH